MATYGAAKYVQFDTIKTTTERFPKCPDIRLCGHSMVIQWLIL